MRSGGLWERGARDLWRISLSDLLHFSAAACSDLESGTQAEPVLATIAIDCNWLPLMVLIIIWLLSQIFKIRHIVAPFRNIWHGWGWKHDSEEVKSGFKPSIRGGTLPCFSHTVDLNLSPVVFNQNVWPGKISIHIKQNQMWYLNLDSSLPMWAPPWEAYIWIQTSPRIVGNHTTTEVKSGFKPLWNQVSFRSLFGLTADICEIWLFQNIWPVSLWTCRWSCFGLDGLDGWAGLSWVS